MIKYAVFDVDGTLLDTSQMWADLPRIYLSSLGVSADWGEVAESIRAFSLPESVSYLQKRFELPLTADEMLKQVNALIEKFYKEQALLCEGAFDLLTLLSERGIKMSIATAGDKRLCLAALERNGVSRFFGGIADCAEFGAKTKPNVYFAAADMIYAQPTETIVFEDSLFALKTAKSVGFNTAGVRDISEPNQADLEKEADFYAHSLGEYCLNIDELLG